MSTPGPKPKPTHLRIVQGERKDRINTAEPTPSAKPPRAPAWLSDDAKKVWRRTVAQLKEMGIASEADTDILAAYCTAVVNLQRATEIVDRTGIMVKGRRDGVVKNPAVQIQRDAAQLVARLGAEFGLTPSSRSRVRSTDAGSDIGDLLD